MRMFLALARYRSLSGAARALHVNHATVARRIQSLESSLGEKLVERRPDGYVLTAPGESALEVATEMDTAMQTLTRTGASGGDTLRGLVRINAPPALAQGFLLARLADITVAHPALDIDLATDLRSISLNRHKADIAVRVGRPADADIIAKPVGSMAFGIYGTAAQCERAERGESPTFVCFNEESGNMYGSTWLTQKFPRSRIAFRAENHIFQAIAAQSGTGLALLPHYLGRGLPDLRLCALGPMPPPLDMWLLIRRQDRNVATIRAVMQYLADSFRENESLFVA
jgi:DNA-binding transcriptional LysR family regulator